MEKSKIVDVIFSAAIVLTAVVSIGAVHANPAEPKASEMQELVCEPSSETTTEQNITDITEPIQKETATTEVTEPPEAEPPVALYDVPLEEDLQIYIVNLCEEKHIDPAIVMAMAFYESTYRTDAIGDGGNSYGLLQVQPKWHYERMQRLGCLNLLDPFQNVMVGIDYLCELVNRYGDIEKALTAYNSGSYNGTVTYYAKSVIAQADVLSATTYNKAV